MVLRGSATQSLSLDVWFDVLNALMSGGGENLAQPRRLRSGQNLARLKEEARIYATEQKMLTYLQVRVHSRESLLKYNTMCTWIYHDPVHLHSLLCSE